MVSFIEERTNLACSVLHNVSVALFLDTGRL